MRCGVNRQPINYDSAFDCFPTRVQLTTAPDSRLQACRVPHFKGENAEIRNETFSRDTSFSQGAPPFVVLPNFMS